MKNTEIEYMYRDASNYKAFANLVVAGVIEEEAIRACLASINEDNNFIPYQVGLEDLQPQMLTYPSADDHVWHEFESARPTDRPPTVTITAAQLLQNFQKIKGRWDVTAACRKHGFEVLV